MKSLSLAILCMTLIWGQSSSAKDDSEAMNSNAVFEGAANTFDHGNFQPNPYYAYACLRISVKGQYAMGYGRNSAEAAQDAEYGASYAEAEPKICGKRSYHITNCELIKTETGLRFYGRGYSEAEAALQAFQNCGNCYRYAHVRRCY